MNIETVVCLWILHKRNSRHRNRKRNYWVHPLLLSRPNESQYITLYPKLRAYEPKFFNYFRMSVKSFDDLLILIKDEIAAEQNAVRYCISPEEKLIITLR